MTLGAIGLEWRHLRQHSPDAGLVFRVRFGIRQRDWRVRPQTSPEIDENSPTLLWLDGLPSGVGSRIRREAYHRHRDLHDLIDVTAPRRRVDITGPQVIAQAPGIQWRLPPP